MDYIRIANELINMEDMTSNVTIENLDENYKFSDLNFVSPWFALPQSTLYVKINLTLDALSIIFVGEGKFTGELSIILLFIVDIMFPWGDYERDLLLGDLHGPG